MTDERGVTVVLYELLLLLDEASAAVWDDGGPYNAGIREGLERAAGVVRDRLARTVETGRS